MSDTIFTKIINREINADTVYEDDTCLAFNDIAPQAPVHFLVIPKTATLDATTSDVETLGHLMQIAARLGSERCPNGFRVVTNIGEEGGQSVPHLHLHVLGGRALKWPPG